MSVFGGTGQSVPKVVDVRRRVANSSNPPELPEFAPHDVSLSDFLQIPLLVNQARYAAHLRVPGAFGKNAICENALLVVDNSATTVYWWHVSLRSSGEAVVFNRQGITSIPEFAQDPSRLVGVLCKGSLVQFESLWPDGDLMVRMYGYDFSTFDDIMERVSGLHFADFDSVRDSPREAMSVTYMVNGAPSGEAQLYDMITNGSEHLVTYLMTGTPFTTIDETVRRVVNENANEARSQRRDRVRGAVVRAGAHAAVLAGTTAVAATTTTAGLGLVSRAVIRRGIVRNLTTGAVGAALLAVPGVSTLVGKTAATAAVAGTMAVAPHALEVYANATNNAERIIQRVASFASVSESGNFTVRITVYPPSEDVANLHVALASSVAFTAIPHYLNLCISEVSTDPFTEPTRVDNNGLSINFSFSGIRVGSAQDVNQIKEYNIAWVENGQRKTETIRMKLEPLSRLKRIAQNFEEFSKRRLGL